jgi:hypothetical protein
MAKKKKTTNELLGFKEPEQPSFLKAGTSSIEDRPKNQFALGGTEAGAEMEAKGRLGKQGRIAAGDVVLPAREVEAQMRQRSTGALDIEQQQVQEKLRLEQGKFKQEDVEKIFSGVEEIGEVEGGIIQEAEAVRQLEERARKNKQIKNYMKQGLTEEEAEWAYQQIFSNPEFSLRQSQGDKAVAALRQTLGDAFQDFLGISLNTFLDQASDPTELSALTGEMSEAASLLPAIEGAVQSEGISPFQALAELNSAEKDGVIIRGDMDRLAVLRPEIVQTKEYHEMRKELEVYIADIRDARSTALEKLRTTSPEFNVLETQGYINQIKGKE